MTHIVPRAGALNRTLIFVAIASCFAAEAYANPVGPSVVAGQASFATAGQSLTVTNSPNAIINWQGFSIGAGEITRFQQQSAASAVLNRVVGQDPSAILGTLSSNGHVYLVNPNGILFGQGSRIDVAGLVASTLNISNQDFLAGRLNFEAGTTAGSLVNRGDIVTGSGGRVLLVAPDVQNHGLISSPQGEVVLAAGKSVQLVEADLPMLKVEVNAGGEALNVGEILAEGGKIGVYAGLINQRGVVRADSASVDATGKIVFRSSDTTLLEAGSVTSAAGAKGGEIQVLGDKVGLTGDAKVDASGEAGGGTVLVGGDFQGKNPEVQNAFRTYFGAEATIKADAITSGDGGKVILWSDDATRAYGTISARGGAQAGDGGLVETSGHFLDVTRAPDVGATNGKGGTWLIDPWNITISAASDQNSSNIGSGTTYTYRGSASPSVVSVSTILAALAAGGDVTVSTTGTGTEQGNITVDAPIATTQTTAATLRLSADNNIQANADISLGSDVNLYLNAGNSVTAANLGGKYVSVGASNGSIATGTVTAGTSGVSMTASGTVAPGAITSVGNVYLYSTASSVTVPNVTTTSGGISIDSLDDLTLANALSAPYGVDIRVRRPGGVFTMLPGSVITGNTSGSGYSTTLRADDMVLGGSIDLGSNGYAYLYPYSSGRDVNVGAATVADALNVSLTELQTVTTGTLEIGASYSYSGTLTVSGALAATDINASNLRLQGSRITTSDIAVNGTLTFYSNSDITAGNLTANSVSVYAYGGGGVTTGTINAASSVYLYGYGTVQPGTITSGGYVSLESVYGSVAVPNITSTGGSISIVSRDDLTLAGTLSAPYGVTLQVSKPGGVLTMSPGSSIAGNTSGSGYSATLRADDMVLGGSINLGSNGYAYLYPYSNGRDVSVGSGTVPGALNLSLAELQTITAGTLEIGASYYYGGNLAVSGALTPSDINATNLQLQGNKITTGDLSVNGYLQLYGNSDIATGSLSANSVYISTSGNGGITTGAIGTTSYANLYAYGPLQTGTITAGGSVNLNSAYSSVTVPNVTTTGGSINVDAFQDLMLANALSSASSVSLDVRKPGGVFTMLPGSAITGSSASLRADDMVLGGSISLGTNGYIYLYPNAYGRDTNIGAGTVAGALNLSVSELASVTAKTLDVRAGSYGNLNVADPITGLAASDLYLRGQHIALGANVGVSGILGVYADRNIDGNTTASAISLNANSITLSAGSGRIYRSGTGVTNINGTPNPSSSSTGYTLSAALGSDLPGSVTASDVNVSIPTGDYTLQTLNGNTVILSVPAGAIVDGNGGANNIIANTLDISAGNGIGSGDAIETAVSVLNASSGGTGNIQITNTGNLAASVTHTGTGGLTLTNYGHLQASAISVPTGNVYITANGRFTGPATSTTGTINLTSYGAAVTGNLSGDSVDIRDYGSGGVTTGTINAASNVYLYGYGTVQPGAITAAGYVDLHSVYSSVTLPNVTTTGGSINVDAFDHLTLSNALSAAYGVTIDLSKPGGVLTMSPGSSIAGNTSGSGYSATLRADDMVLGGSINLGSNGYAYLYPYSNGRDVSVGSGTVPGALNLSLAELQTITAGTLEIRSNYSYGGNLTVSTALTPSDINATNFTLQGNKITTGDLSVGGYLQLYANGDVSTGNLAADSVDITAYGNGGITTGTINTTSSTYLYGYGAVRPGTITAGGYVNLNSAYSGVTVPNVTTNGGGITIGSLDDITLASTLSAPYGVYVEVRRPGGVFTMLPGSTITGNTSGFGYSATLLADDMVLGGSVNLGSNGYAYLYPYSGGRDVNIGTGTLAGALNLAPTELSTISANTLEIGNYYYYYYGRNLTVSSAIASTDLNVGNLRLYGNRVRLGGSIAINGNLGIYSQADLDANTTASTLNLSATGNLDLISYDGRIYRSGTGITNVMASTSNISAPRGVDLGGDISSGDVSITWTSGDYQLNTLTATNLTLDVTNGGIVDTNGTALNITAGTLTLNAADGIGHGKALDTAIGTLTATTSGANNIEISNTGNLTVDSISHTGTGNIVLTNAGSLTLGTASTTTGSFTASATGAIVAGANITAPSVQLSSGGALSQSGGIISNGSLPATVTTTSVGGAVLNGNNLISTFNATNTGGGNIEFRSTVPVLEVTGISQSGGGVTILANDLNLSGTINAGTGLISLAPLSNTSNMFVGAVTGSGLQLSVAELDQIVSTNVELGRSDGTGNLDISLAPTNIVTGSLRLLAGGSVNVSGGPYTLQGGTLQMPGTTNVQSETSVVVQSGALDASGGTVNLSGSLQASGGSVSAGTVNVGGVLSAMGGSFNAGAVNVLSGGLLMGVGPLTTNVTNSGTVSPGASPGILTINGNYVQSPTGTLAVEIGGTIPGTQYDQISVSGSVTLDGNLSTTLIGGYVPAPGDSFAYITTPSTISGSFVSTTQPPSLQAPVTIVAPTSGSQLMVNAVGTSAPVPVVVNTQAEITSNTLPQQQSLPASLASEVESIQSLALEPTGTTQEEKTLEKKPPSCG